MIFISLLAACALAGDFEDGLKAYADSNFTEALSKFEAGCAANDARSCVIAGAIYQAGKTDVPDSNKALEFYNKACKVVKKRVAQQLVEFISITIHKKQESFLTKLANKTTATLAA